MSRSGASPFSRGPYATLSKIVLGNGFGRWNTMPTWRRSATGSMPLENTETPSSRMSPVWRVRGMSSFSRLTERKNVVLPQPDGPIRAVTARRGIVKVRSKSACAAPYQKLYARTSMTGVAARLGRGATRAALGASWEIGATATLIQTSP